MARKFQESRAAKKWLESAKHDLDLAFLINRDSGFTDTVCYFCHQVAEKSLKALLFASNSKNIPHIHQLDVLTKLVLPYHKEIKDFEEEIRSLNKYYIETKYPSDLTVDYPRKEAEKAIAMAETIFDFASKKINI